MYATETKFLPFHQALIEDDDINAVVEVLKSGWITTGPKCREFEEAFARFTGAAHAIALNSGTAALHLALAAIGVSEGDEVILPTLTFSATAEVVLYFRAKPVLVDSDPEFFNLDIEAVERAITPHARAIMPVHFAGQCCDMDRLLELAKQHKLKVVEDAAHALPTRYKGRLVGSLGDISCFSFQAIKTITTGEGGMLTTENEEYAKLVRVLSLHGISKSGWNRYAPNGSWRYHILEQGYKYNLTDFQAALGLSQLRKCDRMWSRRASIAVKYSNALSRIDAFQLPRTSPDVEHAWHLYVIRINPPALRIDREQIIEELRSRGVGTGVHFIPLHLHPLYQARYGYSEGQFPISEAYAQTCISLPTYPGMSDEDVNRVIEALIDIAKRFRR